MLSKVIAIDFDGCICENKWPECGLPNWRVIMEARREKDKGAKLILWTGRSGKDLDEAIRFCRRCGLTFDAVNDNVSERKDVYTNNCRKVWADEYWDDRAVLKAFDSTYRREVDA